MVARRVLVMVKLIEGRPIFHHPCRMCVSMKGQWHNCELTLPIAEGEPGTASCTTPLLQAHVKSRGFESNGG